MNRSAPNSTGKWWKKQRLVDIAFLSALVAFSAYLMRPLFDWNDSALYSDMIGFRIWFYWLEESLFSFHQLPTWSPLWMGGMPFFGMVPPVPYIIVLPLYAITDNIASAYNLAIIIAFSLASITMYLYLKNLTGHSPAALAGAISYLVLPVHIGSIMTMGMFGIMCGYAVAPLVLLFTDRLLDGKSPLSMVLLAISIFVVMLSQIEYAYLFLLFYLCYLFFSLATRRFGWRSVGNLLRKHKVQLAIAALILIIPVSFYISVLAQQHHFAKLSPWEIETGACHWSFGHFGDTFTARAGDYLDLFHNPATEYYSGPLFFVIILFSLMMVIAKKNKTQRIQMLFFLITAIGCLIISMGPHGALFPVLTKIFTPLADMRVPLRFYYIAAICLAVLAALSLKSLTRVLSRADGLSPNLKSAATRLAPILLIIAILLDFSPYFDSYHNRVFDQERSNAYAPFLEEHLQELADSNSSIVRLLTYPYQGTFTDRLAKIENTENGVLIIDTMSTWLPWNQYEEARHYQLSLFNQITEDEKHLRFYCNLLSTDYVFVYDEGIPPDPDPEYTGVKLAELNALSGEDPRPLSYKGSIANEYYAAHLYEVKQVTEKIRFHAASSSLVVLSNDSMVSEALFDIYSQLDESVSTQRFLGNILAVSSDDNEIEEYMHIVNIDDIPQLINDELFVSTGSDNGTEVQGFEVDPKGFSLEVETIEKGILSVVYHYNPWWKVYVDGKRAEVLKVNGIFVGCYLEAGEHQVDFVYDYPSPANIISKIWS